MNTTPYPTRQPEASQSEAGYMLIAVVVMVALVLLALAVAAPIIAKDLRRDKEIESEHRAQQYVRALRLYYRQLKTYPPSLEALQKSNNIRFLRQQYVDPLTGKADWRLIHVGEQKTTVKGFFGEPLSGLNATGLGNSLGSASSLGGGFGGSTTQTGSSTIGATSGLAAGFAGATIGSSTTTATGGGTAGTAGLAGGSGPGSNSVSGSGSGSGSASGSGLGSGFGSGSSGNGFGGTGSGSSSFGAGSLGQIMGVGSARSGTSILTPNEQTSYNTWEFLYDPRIEQLYAKSNILGGGLSSQPASALGKGALSGLSGASGATGGSGATGTSGATGSTGTSNPLFK